MTSDHETPNKLGRQDILELIQTLIGDVAQMKGDPTPKVADSTVLLGGGLPIDSLDLAGIVLRLEEAVGYDPFKEGFIEFRTAGELATLYAKGINSTH